MITCKSCKKKMANIWEYGWQKPGQDKGKLLGYVCANPKCKRYKIEEKR